MSKYLIPEPALQVLPTLACHVGLNEAIFLQQLHWLLDNPKLGKKVDGRKWVKMSMKEWQEDHFRFWTDKVIGRTIDNLIGDGFIERRDDLNYETYDHTYWYSLDYDALAALDGPVARIQSKQEKRKAAVATRYDDAPVQNVPPQVQDVPRVQNVPPQGTKCTPLDKGEGGVQNVRDNTIDKRKTLTEIDCDESLQIAWGMLIAFCGDNKDTAVRLWQLQSHLAEVSRLPLPDIDTERGRAELQRAWWPVLLEIDQKAGGELATAKTGMNTAVSEIDAWKPEALQAPKSILKKTIAYFAAAQRGAANGHVTKMPSYAQYKI